MKKSSLLLICATQSKCNAVFHDHIKEKNRLSKKNEQWAIDRFHYHAIENKNKSKTIQWIKSRNCDLIGNI